MVRIKRSYRIQVCSTKMHPNGELPSDPQQTDRQAPTRHRSYAKSPVAVHRRSACSGVKALRNTSPARRQAAKLCYRFGPWTPSARSANLIAGDGTKNGFPAPNKEPATNQKRPLEFESTSLQRTVRLSRAAAFDHREPRLSVRVCAAGLVSGTAETRRVFRYRANWRRYLCRAIFQYRGALMGSARKPRCTRQGQAFSGFIVRWIFEFGSGSTKAEHDPLIVPGKRQT